MIPPLTAWPIPAVRLLGWVVRGVVALVGTLVIIAGMIASITLGSPGWK